MSSTICFQNWSGRAMGQIGTATTFITHTRIKAILLEKEEFKSNQLYIQL